MFYGIHRYTLPQRQNLYGLVLFLLFQLNFFSNLYCLVPAPSIGRNLVVLAPILVFFMSTRPSRSVD
jgi:hypothetical protein